MLYFIGLGIDQSPSQKTLTLLDSCSDIFYESYTSPTLRPNEDFLLGNENLREKTHRVSRQFVEDGRKILELAGSKDLALLSSGDPMIATTHEDLRVRAIKKGISTKIVHGSSILSCLPGELGLHAYSFGKCVTITKEPMQYTAYETIYQNLLRGLHTTILLEWDEASDFFLPPTEALASLVSAEKDLKYGILSDRTQILAVSRIGTEEQKLTICNLAESVTEQFGAPPTSLVIPGRLHFTECEALAAIFGREPESFSDNSANIDKISRKMVSRYSQKTSAALERARSAVKTTPDSDLSRIESLFENIECYTEDAKRFANEGKDELAVLSIGYAEGLLDSLRFLGILDFEW